MNIISPTDMIYLLEDFDNSPVPLLRIGEIAGCGLFKIVADNVIGQIAPFEKTLFIQGCQDMIGKHETLSRNVVFWADLFMDQFRGYNETNPFEPVRISSKSARFDRFGRWRLVIIIDAHLIPSDALRAIENNCNCKIIELTDPFDVEGELFSGVPCIADTFNKVSPLVAYARRLYGISTRLIDNKSRQSINFTKHISKRSAGKLDEKQYVCTDDEFIEEVREKQLKSGFRKNYKVICMDNHINLTIDSKTGNELAFPMYSMGTIVSVPKMQLSTIRLYNTKYEYYCKMSYDMRDDAIYVKPANIISSLEAAHHRFQNSVFITDEHTTVRQLYSIVKNSSHITVTKI